MPEEFDDSQLSETFARYRAEVISEVSGQDITGGYSIARRRARRQVAAAIATVAAAIIVPAAAFAVSERNDHTDPARPSPSVSASPSPSSRGPSEPPAAAQSGDSAQVPPVDGRLSMEQLTAAAVDLPAWQAANATTRSECPIKGVRMRPGPENGDALNVAYVNQLEYGDLDRDGAQETVALLVCRIGQGTREQVVAFQRDEDGSVVVLGRVIGQGEGTGSIQRLYRFEIDEPTGGVGVDVGDAYGCCGKTEAEVEHQTRWYTWNGDRFQQTDGPTSFTAVPTKYGIPTVAAPATVVLGAASNGLRQGVIQITVTNPDAAASPGVYLTMQFTMSDGAAPPSNIQLAGATTGCDSNPSGGWACHFPALAAKASATYTFTVTSPVANDSIIAGSSTCSLLFNVKPEQPGVRVLSGWKDVNGTSGKTTLQLPSS